MYKQEIHRFRIGVFTWIMKRLKSHVQRVSLISAMYVLVMETRTDNGRETYGMSMEEAEKMFPTGYADYGISLEAFVEQEKMNGR